MARVGNGQGSTVVRLDMMMLAYDTLPAQVRRALAEHDFPVNPVQCHGLLRDGWTVELVVRGIAMTGPPDWGTIYDQPWWEMPR